MGPDLGALALRYTGLAVSDHDSIVAINIFIALLCGCIVFGHLLEGNRWVNESTTAIVLGLITGGVILLCTKGVNSRILIFSEDIFFIYLLPPIIFNAGFQVKKKQFFRNFATIILFGAVGTLISFVIITLGAMGLFRKLDVGPLELGDYLAIGAIFSATDSVCTLQVLNQDQAPLLYSLVFGEGVVNDATSVVLFNAIQNIDLNHFDVLVLLQLIGKFLYLFLTSTVLGVAAGLLSAYIIKKLCFARHSTDREVAIMILMAYLSYMLSMLLDLSGILTVFFCGIVMSHYTWHNVTESSRVTTKHTFATLSFIAEIFLFLYVGMDALDIDKWKLASSSPKKPIALSAVILGLVMVGRAAFVFPLSYLSNLSKKESHPKISFNQQVIIWWAGLMRGAVSIALAYNKYTTSGHTAVRVNAVMITSTIIVVLFSTMVFGLLTKPLINLLVPPRPGTAADISSQSFLDPLTASLLGSDFDVGQLTPQTNLQYLLTMPTRSVHRVWRKFDDKFMRPMFGGRGFVPFVPGSPIERSVHGPGLLGTVTEAENRS
ncbi:vacuolar Na+/H+ antiporter [Hordeum vulgare]|uniref:Cation/H+ exchanger transmembrane domain-containing protein n=3 Tax=Hordeum vulgare TaxID=4513 RepID=M0UGC6_HORVV|nr:sodium/hydrogen exchanger 1-like [Hordeum vulgare subsp. vulgare]XP_044964667.1 sodium/hydrogen exchanger 1-like [Hordeum vulgare subsp. vulgare]AAO91943.2 vacuolar Na+/H+ antiporter [Hordeum vulgare]AEM44689.1 vacuolar Na+/H+ antiporter 2 [Hordeum vulgare subsp. spontaneum]KAE8799864.1 vacuolar Na+/H+ antiporter [Hordeum vulgare]